MSRKRVFVSHINSEKEFAQSLKQRLEKHFLGLLDIFVSSDRETKIVKTLLELFTEVQGRAQSMTHHLKKYSLWYDNA